MASGYVQNGGVPLQMSRSNLRYWDADSGQWKAPDQAYYYNGSQWIPFILSIPSPGTRLVGNSEGKVFRYSFSSDKNGTYYVHPLSLIADAGYDTEATKASGGDVTLRMKRASDSSTSTRNINFRIILRDSDDSNVVSTSPFEGDFVSQGEEFALTFPRDRMTNGMYFRWSWFSPGTENTGWEFRLDDTYFLEF